MSFSVYEIFESIKNTSGKNDKIEIIKSHGDNIEFQEFLKFLYDEMITTGLSAKKINKKVKPQAGIVTHFQTPLAVMGYVSEFNTGTDNNILHVQTYLHGLEEPYRTFMSDVLSKSYKCGITASSINKALGKGFIPEFKVQLAHSYEKFADRVDDTFYLSLKLDGHRTLAFVEYENDRVVDVKFRTRKGHEVTGLNQIKDEIIKRFNSFGFVNAKSVVLDGEITVLDDTTDPASVFQSTSKIIRKDGDKTGLKFQVFDYIMESEFWEGKSSQSYLERREVIENLFNQVLVNTKYVTEVPTLYVGKDVSEIAKWSNRVTEQGYEGIMLNTAEGMYETKRTPHLLKVKKFHSADILATGIFEGEGRLSGTLGGIYVDFKGTKVGVGTGFTDEQRDYYWSNQDEIVGRVVEIKYFEESTNQKDDSISLRFPVFVSVRSDKTSEDVNYD